MAVVRFIPPFSNRNTLALPWTNYDSSIIQPVTYSIYRVSYAYRSKEEDREQFKLFSCHQPFKACLELYVTPVLTYTNFTL